MIRDSPGGGKEGGHNFTLKTVNIVLLHDSLIVTSVGWVQSMAQVCGKDQSKKDLNY